MKDTQNNNYQNPKQVSARKQAIGTLIGLFIGLAIFYVLFDVIGIGGSVIPKRNYEPTSSVEQLDGSVEFGEYNGDVYKNNYTHLSFKLPDEDWTYKSEEDIRKILGSDKAKMNDSFKVYAENELEVCYYDMIAFDEVRATSIQLAMTVGKKENYSQSSTSDLYIKGLCDTITQEDSSARISDIYGIVVGGENYRAVDVDYTSIGSVQTIAVRKNSNGYTNLLVTRYYELDNHDNNYYFDLFSKC